nr:integrase, catalytic region, zinc finger, CCHC-type, peptidase aspartic, catalytic [Tanacetum cinerariifolium]
LHNKNCRLNKLWLRISNPTIESSSTPPVKVEVPSELPKNESCINQNAPEILEYFEKNDLKAKLQDKDTTILKATVDNVTQIPSATAIAPGMFKLDLEPLAPKLVHNREIYINYLNHTQEQADILQDILVKRTSKYGESNAITSSPLSNLLFFFVFMDDEMITLSDYLSNAPVKDFVNDVKSRCLCAICGNCMIAKTHACVNLVVTKMNESQKSKSVKKHKNQNVWKPTGNVFTDVGYKWKPIGRTFTIVGKSFPLNRITSTNIVPPKKTPSHSVKIQKQEIKVYSRKPKNVKNVGSSKISKIVQSKNANHSEPNHNWGSIATDISSSFSLVMTGTVRFGNDQIARIIGYGDIQLGNVIISRLSKDGLTRGIPRLKFQKDHMCSACALGKSKKSSHQPKAEDTNQEKLYLLHMDLCGPMHVTFCEFYVNVGISHQTSVARTPQQNGVVESLFMCLVSSKAYRKHLQAVKRIFQYLKGTIMGLSYSKDTDMSLTTYADADHAGCQDTRCSTSGSA